MKRAGQSTGYILAVFLLLALPALSCSLAEKAIQAVPTGDQNAAGEAPGAGGAAATEAEAQAQASPTPRNTLPPPPTAVPLIEVDTGAPAGRACFGSFEGVTCLDEYGWHAYTEENSNLESRQVHDLVFCPDGRLLAGHTFGLSSFDGQSWLTLPLGDFFTADALACDAENRIWVAHWEGLSMYDGSRWSEYSSDLMATGDAKTGLLYDVTVAPDGTVYVVTANSIARFDGANWTVYQQGQGLDDLYFFSSIKVDNTGRPWAAQSSGFLTFEDDIWTSIETGGTGSVDDMFIDSLNRVWAATYDGLYVFHDGGWTHFNPENSGLTSESVRSVAVDDSGRLWAGTSWGLNVYDGQTWTSYHMYDSDLVSNSVTTIVTEAGGPTLPPPAEKAPGSLSGQLMVGEEPLANAPVEICIETIGFFYSGDTPCSDQQYMMRTETDGQGFFKYEELPVGEYIITALLPNGNWAQYETEFGTTEVTVVREGENTDVGKLTAEMSE